MRSAPAPSLGVALRRGALRRPPDPLLRAAGSFGAILEFQVTFNLALPATNISRGVLQDFYPLNFWRDSNGRSLSMQIRSTSTAFSVQTNSDCHLGPDRPWQERGS